MDTFSRDRPAVVKKINIHWLNTGLCINSSQVALVAKDPPAKAGNDTASIPGLGRSPGAGMATHSSLLA